jgi:hypothetical protein
MTIHCVLNPQTKIYANLTQCGIQIIMDKKLIVSKNDITVLLKGEIYNRLALCIMLEIDIHTKLENIIIIIYKRYGIEYLLQILDGSFAFILFDYDYMVDISKVYIVKDLFGMIPFFTYMNNTSIEITTEKHQVESTESTDSTGCYTLYELGSKVSAKWELSNIVNKPYFAIPNSIILPWANSFSHEHLSCLHNSKQISKSNDGFSISLSKSAKCIKNIIMKMFPVSDRIADFIVDKLFENITTKTMNDVPIYDDINHEIIHFSPMNFFEISENDTIFDYDMKVRKQLYNRNFSPKIKYPFFDREFVNLYFSIPLHMRYTYHGQLFTMYS